MIAHRGASAEAPENTLEAFDLSVELGADALELDVQRAADGTLVVIHDPTLDRTTPAEGRVADFDADELGRLGVPALETVLRRYPDLEVTVDVKRPSATSEVVALIGRLGRAERTVLYVEDGTGLEAFTAYGGRRATSTRQAAWLAGELSATGPPPAIRARTQSSRAGGTAPGRAPRLPEGFPEVVHTPLGGPAGPIVTEGFVAAVHGTGRTIQVWTVDDPDGMRQLARWGVDGIITNDVRRAVSLLREVDEPS